MDAPCKTKVSAKWKSYRERLKKDPERLREEKEKRKVLNSRRKKINDMTEEEKKVHREKKKLYMAFYRQKLKDTKDVETSRRDGDGEPGKIENNKGAEEKKILLPMELQPQPQP